MSSPEKSKKKKKKKEKREKKKLSSLSKTLSGPRPVRGPSEKRVERRKIHTGYVYTRRLKYLPPGYSLTVHPLPPGIGQCCVVAW